MRRSATQLTLGLLAAAALGGCGVSASKPPSERGAELATHVPSSPLLSDRRPGTVLEQTAATDALSPLAITPYEAQTSGHIEAQKVSSQRAVASVCNGSVDLIEPGRNVTASERAACARNHLELIGPLTIASDAVVIAVKNEADIGGDCLTRRQARDIFRAGSPYSNWNQLGFDNVPISTTSSLTEPVPDELFARTVLGEDQPLTSAALRGDFTAAANADATREAIVGTARASAAQAAARRMLAELRAQAAAARRRFVDAAVARADRAVLRQIAAVNERNRRLKINVNAEQLDRHNARMDAAAKRAAATRAGAEFDAALARRADRETAPLLARAQTPGVVGFLDFTYYEQWEEQLRPFEIWSSGSQSTQGGSAPNCVFPSAQTISSGHYPFSFQLVLYTTRQALERSVVRDYLTYLFANAQTFAERSGLVPITDRQRNSDLLAIGVQPPSAQASPPAVKPSVSASPSQSAGTGSPQALPQSAVPGVGASAQAGKGG